MILQYPQISTDIVFLTCRSRHGLLSGLTLAVRVNDTTTHCPAGRNTKSVFLFFFFPRNTARQCPSRRPTDGYRTTAVIVYNMTTANITTLLTNALQTRRADSGFSNSCTCRGGVSRKLTGVAISRVYPPRVP